MNIDIENKKIEWVRYLMFLKQWTEDHSDPLFYGSCPPSFDEYLDMDMNTKDEENENNN